MRQRLALQSRHGGVGGVGVEKGYMEHRDQSWQGRESVVVVVDALLKRRNVVEDRCFVQSRIVVVE